MQRKPEWLKVKLLCGKEFNKVSNMLKDSKLHTICEEARCPNKAECYGHGTATFLILGKNCTRNCLYCNVNHGKPESVNESEPKNIAAFVNKLNLNYVVITSVTRDDLEDQGSKQFAKTISGIKNQSIETKVELLIPEMDEENLRLITNSKPDVLGHNIEVVKSLFLKLRPQGNYEESLELLRIIKKISPKQKTKSGLMIGLAETKEEIIKAMKDLRNSNVDFLTIGQYLQPRKDLSEVKKFYTPQEFEELKKIALELGFEHVESGPLVRSSYRADKLNKYC